MATATRLPEHLPGVSRATAIDLVTNVTQLYADLQTRLAVQIANNLKAGLSSPKWLSDKAEQAARLHVWAKTALQRLEKDTSREVTYAIMSAYTQGGQEATKALLRLGHGFPATPDARMAALLSGPESQLTKGLTELGQAFPGIHAMQRVSAALTARINGTHVPVLRWTDDAFRQVVGQVGLVDVLAGVATRRETAQKVWDRLLDNGVTGFTDVRGRNWNLASYVEMATRTGVAHAAVEGHLDRLTDAGIDLVIVSNAPHECPLCRPWEGKILSRSGIHTPLPKQPGVVPLVEAPTVTAAKFVQTKPVDNLHEPVDFSSAFKVDVLNRPEREKAEALIKHMFDGTYAGLKVTTDNVSIYGDQIVAEGLIHDRDGNPTGIFKRSYLKDAQGITAHHELLQIERHTRGQGFAQEFNGHLEESYRHSGVDRIKLNANIDVGGYAWARSGYDFADRANADGVASRLRDELDHAKHLAGTELHAQVSEVLRRFRTVPFGKPGYPTAYEISQLGRPKDAGRDKKWIGKDTLLGSSWDGVKRVQPE